MSLSFVCLCREAIPVDWMSAGSSWPVFLMTSGAT